MSMVQGAVQDTTSLAASNVVGGIVFLSAPLR